MTQLQKTLGPVMIWGLGVGYVIYKSLMRRWHVLKLLAKNG